MASALRESGVGVAVAGNLLIPLVDEVLWVVVTILGGNVLAVWVSQAHGDGVLEGSVSGVCISVGQGKVGEVLVPGHGGCVVSGPELVVVVQDGADEGWLVVERSGSLGADLGGLCASDGGGLGRAGSSGRGDGRLGGCHGSLALRGGLGSTDLCTSAWKGGGSRRVQGSAHGHAGRGRVAKGSGDRRSDGCDVVAASIGCDDWLNDVGDDGDDEDDRRGWLAVGTWDDDGGVALAWRQGGRWVGRDDGLVGDGGDGWHN